MTPPGPAPTRGSVRIHLLWLMSITWVYFHLHVHPYPAMHVDPYADRPGPQRQTRSRIRELERLNPGMKVTLTAAAA